MQRRWLKFVDTTSNPHFPKCLCLLEHYRHKTKKRDLHYLFWKRTWQKIKKSGAEVKEDKMSSVFQFLEQNTPAVQHTEKKSFNKKKKCFLQKYTKGKWLQPGRFPDSRLSLPNSPLFSSLTVQVDDIGSTWGWEEGGQWKCRQCQAVITHVTHELALFFCLQLVDKRGVCRRGCDLSG